MDVQVALVTAALNHADRTNPNFLVVRRHDQQIAFPLAPLTTEKSCEDTASELLLNYTGIDRSRWPAIPMRLAGVFHSADRKMLTVAFRSMVPEDTRLHGGAAWVKIRDLIESGMAEDHLSVLSAATAHR